MSAFTFPAGTAVVTGAARGIGAQTAQMLLRHGVPVAAIDREADTLLQWTGRAQAEGLPVTPHVADLRDLQALPVLAQRIAQRHGPVSMLAHVAGVLHLASLEETPLSAWQATFDVNVHAPFLLAQALAPAMRQRGDGRIVMVGSNAALVPRTHMGAYAASKAALHHLARCMGLEWAADGIRCNVVAPGSTDTPMQHQLWTHPGARQRVIAGDLASHRTGIPLGRIADPQDVARAVLYLLADESAHVTLQTLCIDGGATLGV
ncbi:MAG: SDR family oxidoreductase [Burkholderiaceae bacterium]|nr:MAG: SDR family oxidoreductase [Burkholderiaceae bacterium]